jgi:hypothetical protein
LPHTELADRRFVHGAAAARDLQSHGPQNSMSELRLRQLQDRIEDGVELASRPVGSQLYYCAPWGSSHGGVRCGPMIVKTPEIWNAAGASYAQEIRASPQSWKTSTESLVTRCVTRCSKEPNS